MQPTIPNAIGRAAARTVPVLLLVLAGCGASHRSTANLAEKHPIAPGVARVRIEIDNGTIGVDVAPAREVAIAGGIRRAAESAADLVVLEQIPASLTPVVDPTQPDTLVLRGPKLPEGMRGLLGFELGVHVPADLPLEIVIGGSGHVTLARRLARTKVKTGRGDLRFEDCAGGVQAKTGRGNVIAFEHRGDLDIHTDAGDMQAFVREPAATIRLVTGQGTVQLHVPPETPFDVDARAEIGRIGNGFGLTAQKVARYGAALVGKQGPATTAVVLRTGSGHLSFTPKQFEPRPR
jgi:hypothetical protein